MANTAQIVTKVARASGGRRGAESELEIIRAHYAEFTQMLEERTGEINVQNRATRSRIDEQVMDSPGDVGDSSVLDASADYYLNMAEHLSGELRQISDALDRLQSGSYGICQTCENAVALERLRKLPYARNCIDCQSAAEVGRLTRTKSG